MPIFDQISGFSKRKFFFTGQLRCCTSTKRTLERTDCTILCYATTERTICYPSPQLHSHCILPLRTSLFFTCTTILLRYNQLVSFLSRTYVPNLCDTTCEVKIISSSTEQRTWNVGPNLVFLLLVGQDRQKLNQKNQIDRAYRFIQDIKNKNEISNFVQFKFKIENFRIC